MEAVHMTATIKNRSYAINEKVMTMDDPKPEKYDDDSGLSLFGV
jgi:hypothetical protein